MRKILVQFRWPVRQIAPAHVEVCIPTSPNGEPILNPQFCDQHRLSDAEVELAEIAALSKIVVLPEPSLPEPGTAKL